MGLWYNQCMDVKNIDNKENKRCTHHSVFNILVEVELFTKNKKEIIDSSINDKIYELFARIGKVNGIDIVMWSLEKNGVKMTLSLPPSANLTKYLNAAKASSSRMIKKEFRELSNLLCDEKFWERGFTAFSLDARI